VLRALDAGAEAIYLEEPEFWARAGWSDSFKKEWESYYHEPWRAPDSSPDAQYRASKLKYFLYQRALAQVFTAVREWGKEHGKQIPCYVATHSVINYAQWQIVSPESSLLDVGSDGYIAQVWTGTSRAVNVYQGIRAERTFETAFLEYGALQNIARSSGKRIWYLNDPIEDNPNHSWTDYKRNWESTLVASLLQPEVSSYEILPWPDRIFGPNALRPATEPTEANPQPEKSLIPAEYEAELQTVFHALGKMHDQQTQWQVSGTRGVGVLVSDTLMFERANPLPSDAALGNFYGLAMPLLMHGLPVEPVQIESTYRGSGAADFLKQYKVLLLTYEGQKPPSPKFHEAIAAWVKAGGALVIVDNDSDPYNHAHDWWNENGKMQTTPRDLLFRTLGIEPSAEGLHHIGQGTVRFRKASPAALAADANGANKVLALTKQAVSEVKLPWRESSALVLRRGPFIIASGLDKPEGTPEPGEVTKVASSAVQSLPPATTAHTNTTARATSPAKPTLILGHFLDLFDPHLRFVTNLQVNAGDRCLLLDPIFFSKGGARILAASAKVLDERSNSGSIRFSTSNIEGRDEHDFTVVRLLLPRHAKSVTLDGKPLATGKWENSTLLLEFPARAATQNIVVEF
jgi:cell division septation protein DedD